MRRIIKEDNLILNLLRWILSGRYLSTRFLRRENTHRRDEEDRTEETDETIFPDETFDSHT
jgi:hypothetical protein